MLFILEAEIILSLNATGKEVRHGENVSSRKRSVQNSATFPTLLLKSSKKVVFLSEISSK